MISEALSTFRKKINLQAFIVTSLGVTLVVVYIFLRSHADPVIQGIAWIAGLFGAFLAVYMMIRRSQMLRVLQRHSDPAAAVVDIEKYLTQQSNSFKAGTPVRVSIAILIALGMVLSIIYRPDSFYTGATIMSFIAMILLSMITGWMHMQQLMMLQDLKHDQRDHPSDIS